jgi:hypothetical protein
LLDFVVWIIWLTFLHYAISFRDVHNIFARVLQILG